MTIKAVIFDLDGVLSDTQKFHAEVESALLKEFGVHLSPESITSMYAGVSDEEMFAEIFEKHGVTAASIGDVVRRKWDLMVQVARGSIVPVPHAVNLVRSLKRKGMKLAIASASSRTFIEEVVRVLGIKDCFSAIVSASEVARGKPAPDIFLLAARRLGVRPEESIVIEDGVRGMQGALAAGMKCIGLVSDASASYPATRIVVSLADVTDDVINTI